MLPGRRRKERSSPFLDQCCGSAHFQYDSVVTNIDVDGAVLTGWEAVMRALSTAAPGNGLLPSLITRSCNRREVIDNTGEENKTVSRSTVALFLVDNPVKFFHGPILRELWI
jgi:hypothetical protein